MEKPVPLGPYDAHHELCGQLGLCGSGHRGQHFAANGVITIGDIQAFIQYVKNFTQPIQQLSQVSNMLQSMAAAAERVFEF